MPRSFKDKSGYLTIVELQGRVAPRNQRRQPQR